MYWKRDTYPILMRVTRQKQIITNIVVVQVFQRSVPVRDVTLRNVSLGSGVRVWV